MSGCSPKRTDCDDLANSGTDSPVWLERIVKHYIKIHRPRVAEEMAFYEHQPSIEAAIELAALAKTEKGKRHSHQRRIPAAVLYDAMERLMQDVGDLQACQSFEELIAVVNAAIRPIKGIGELTVYDTALRIGAYLGLTPDTVYVHSGTRTGLKKLGLFHGQKSVSPANLPEPFDRLKPQEIEDCLCIYKKRFRLLETRT